MTISPNNELHTMLYLWKTATMLIRGTGIHDLKGVEYTFSYPDFTPYNHSCYDNKKSCTKDE